MDLREGCEEPTPGSATVDAGSSNGSATPESPPSHNAKRNCCYLVTTPHEIRNRLENQVLIVFLDFMRVWAFLDFLRHVLRRIRNEQLEVSFPRRQALTGTVRFGIVRR